MAAGSRSLLSLPFGSLPQICNEVDDSREGGGESYAGTSLLNPWRGLASATLAPLVPFLSCCNKSALGRCVSSCSLPFLAMVAGKERIGRNQFPGVEECCFVLCWRLTGNQFFPSFDFSCCAAMGVVTRGLEGGVQLKMEYTPTRSGTLLSDELELILKCIDLKLLIFPRLMCTGYLKAAAISPLCMAEGCLFSVRLLAVEIVADKEMEILGKKIVSLEANWTNIMISMTWYVDLDFHHDLFLEITNFSPQYAHHIRFQSISRVGCACMLTRYSFGNNTTVSKEQVSATCFACITSTLMVGYSVEDIVSFLFGLCHRRWTTAPSLLILRFNRGDSSSLSSVKPIRYLQLNTHKPRVHTPERPSEESSAGHQLVWSTNEALGDCNCSKFEPELSTDDRPLCDSNCSLRYLLCKSWLASICSMRLSISGSYSVVQFVSLYLSR